MANFTRMAINYPFEFPSISELSVESLRRHATHALSVNRFDISAEYQAELTRREASEASDSQRKAAWR